jgi:hypothetical protein
METESCHKCLLHESGESIARAVSLLFSEPGREVPGFPTKRLAPGPPWSASKSMQGRDRTVEERSTGSTPVLSSQESREC